MFRANFEHLRLRDDRTASEELGELVSAMLRLFDGDSADPALR